MPEEEVSTTIGTPYSSSFGITASVRVELQAPIMTGTLSLLDQLLGGADRLGRVGLVVLDDELDLLAQHAAGLVDLVLGDLRALRDVVARRGEGAGQRLRHADLDRLLRVRARDETAGQNGRRRYQSYKLPHVHSSDPRRPWSTTCVAYVQGHARQAARVGRRDCCFKEVESTGVESEAFPATNHRLLRGRVQQSDFGRTLTSRT